MRSLRITAVLAVGAAALAGAPAVAETLAADAKAAAAPVPVVRHLNNPRQLDLTREGALIVAESGTGGDRCADVDGEQVCFGTTGSVATVLAPGKVRDVEPLRIVTGLLSDAGPGGASAGGNTGASARSLEEVHVVKDVDLPASVTGLPGEQQGTLMRAVPQTAATVVADLRAFEAAKDPDKQGAESNPYAVLDLGGKVLVADAAGNDILSVDRNGKISVFAVLPNVTGGACDTRPNQGGTFCDPVPTSLTFSKDGDIIVAGLGSLVPGAGRVWELDRRNGAIQKTWTGFTGVTGAAQDHEGTLYVSQLFAANPAGPPGQVVLVPTKGARATLPVPFPHGIVADPEGRVYVAAWSTSTAAGGTAPDSDGQVWRISRRSF